MPRIINGRSSYSDDRGTILQAQHAETTSEVTLSATKTYEELGANVTLVSKGRNSKFLLFGHGHMYGTSSGANRMNLGFSVTIGGTTTRILGTDGGAGDSWANEQDGASGQNGDRCYMYTVTAAPGTSMTFKLLAASWDVSGTTGRFNLSGYAFKSILEVLEIAT
tara:strand:- start:83 stop:577 length:495 start_codon:yes stop_codon:yes gene_type:complete